MNALCPRGPGKAKGQKASQVLASQVWSDRVLGQTESSCQIQNTKYICDVGAVPNYILDVGDQVQFKAHICVQPAHS